jgi:hypothetical protein
VTSNGPDVISYHLDTKRITFWDDKMRSEARKNRSLGDVY